MTPRAFRKRLPKPISTSILKSARYTRRQHGCRVRDGDKESGRS
jgi:hypothetical protein